MRADLAQPRTFIGENKLLKQESWTILVRYKEDADGLQEQAVAISGTCAIARQNQVEL